MKEENIYIIKILNLSISFLEEEVLITVQGNGRIFKCQMKSGAYSGTPFLVVVHLL